MRIVGLITKSRSPRAHGEQLFYFVGSGESGERGKEANAKRPPCLQGGTDYHSFVHLRLPSM